MSGVQNKGHDKRKEQGLETRHQKATWPKIPAHSVMIFGELSYLDTKWKVNYAKNIDNSKWRESNLETHFL